MEPIKVLHVVDNLAQGGGAQRQVVSLVRFLAGERFQPYVCYLYQNGDLRPQLESKGIPVSGLGIRNLYDWKRAIFGLKHLIEEHEVDIVQASMYGANLYSRIAVQLSRPIVVINWVHGPLYELLGDTGPPRSLRFLARHHLDTVTARFWVDHFVATSLAVRRFIVRHYQVPENMVSVIYNGLDLNEFNPASEQAMARLRRELNLSDAFPVLISVGRLSVEKGQRCLIEAFGLIKNEMPQAKLLLAGGGDLATELCDLRDSLGMTRDILFLGIRGDIKELLQLSDVFISSSLSEGLPIAVIEAMAMGKPCIVSRIEPHLEVVEEGKSGLFVNSQDPAKFASAVVDLCEDRQAMTQMGQRGRDIVEDKFDIRKNVRLMEALYLECLKEPDVP